MIVMNRSFLYALLLTCLIYACGGGGGSGSTSTPPPNKPLPPRRTAFINVSSSYLAIFAHWSSISEAKYYKLYYSSYSSLPLKNNSDVGYKEVFHNYTTILTTIPKRYYLTVTAVNDVGESEESKRQTAVTYNPPPPSPPNP